ncbi:hypothetical protein U1Q18_025872 [Sarracenia purpurea var. burkii]
MASVLSPPCPLNSFLYTTSLCACDPGHLYNATTKSCDLFRVFGDEWVVESGVDYSISFFPETIFSFDSIKKFTQSQALFLEATFVLLVSWLAFCFFVRCGKLHDGRTIWFRIRWWISRLDICFATRHWLCDSDIVEIQFYNGCRALMEMVMLTVSITTSVFAECFDVDCVTVLMMIIFWKRRQTMKFFMDDLLVYAVRMLKIMGYSFTKCRGKDKNSLLETFAESLSQKCNSYQLCKVCEKVGRFVICVLNRCVVPG